jgi:hypothetical protein
MLRPAADLRDPAVLHAHPSLEDTGFGHDPGVFQQKVQTHPDIPLFAKIEKSP